MASGDDEHPDERSDETHRERVNRELHELLNEIRVALPGVQILFAFLLTLPFTNRFTDLTDGQRYVYFAALVCSAAATALFIAPTAYHRLRFRDGDKERMLFSSSHMVIGGLVLILLAISAAMFLIADLVFSSAAAVAAAVLAALWFAWFWFGLPISRRVADDGPGWLHDDARD